MGFDKNKYKITRDYIRHGNSRSGAKNYGIRFIVAHDTGNPGSTAYGNRSWFNNSQPSASAHTFIDDKYILEIVPLNEKAWHVIYNVTTDNKWFGDDANDSAIGVELCWGGKISFQEAYDRYVWYHAYLCDKYSFDPRKKIIGHETLDPARKIDPSNALNRYGKTYAQFINDVIAELKGNYKPVDDGLLEKGESGSKVKDLQRRLTALGYDTKGVDGDFGPNTERALKAFQKDAKIDIDGIAGPQVFKALDLAEKKKSEQAKKKIEEEDDMLETAIVINTYNDYPAAELVALKHKAPIYPRKAISSEVAKHIIVVGGDKEGIKADKITVLAGPDRVETVKAVEKYLK